MTTYKQRALDLTPGEASQMRDLLIDIADELDRLIAAKPAESPTEEGADHNG